MLAQLVRLAGVRREPVHRALVALVHGVVRVLDERARVGRLIGEVLHPPAPVLFAQVVLDGRGQAIGRQPVGDGKVRLVHGARLEEFLVGRAPPPLGREQQQPAREPVEPVRRRELGQAEFGAKLDDDALHDVTPTRNRREKRRLIDHDDAFVAVHDADLAGHLGLVAQVAVKPEESVGFVRVIVPERRAVVPHEALVVNEFGDVDVLAELGIEPVSHGRPWSRVMRIAVWRSYPSGVEAVALGQGRAWWHA